MPDLAGAGYLWSCIPLLDYRFSVSDGIADQYDDRDHHPWLPSAVCEVIAQTQTGVMGFEDDLPYQAYSYLDENLTSDLVALPALVDQYVRLKCRRIDALRASAQLADAGLSVTSLVRPNAWDWCQQR